MKGYQMKSIYKFTAESSQYLRCEARNEFGSSNSTSLYLVTGNSNVISTLDSIYTNLKHINTCSTYDRLKIYYIYSLTMRRINNAYPMFRYYVKTVGVYPSSIGFFLLCANT